MYIPEDLSDLNLKGVMDMMHYVACIEAEDNGNVIKCVEGCNKECVFFNRENLLQALLDELSEEK